MPERDDLPAEPGALVADRPSFTTGQEQPTAAAQPALAPAVPGAGFPGFSGRVLTGTVAVLLMVIGAFGTWAKGPFGATISGIDGSNDGWIVLFIGGFAGLMVFAYARTPSRACSVFLLACSLINGYVAYHDRNALRGHFSVTVDGVATNEDVSDLVQVGWGLNIILAASVLLFIAGLATAGKPPARR